MSVSGLKEENDKNNMKKRFIYNWIGIVLLCFMISFNYTQLDRYLTLGLYKTTIGYPTYIGYVFIVLISIVSLIVLGLFFIIKKWLFIDKIFISLYLFTIGFTIYLYDYFEFESNKLMIIVKNLSTTNFESIEINARNNQKFQKSNFNSNDSIKFICECRNIPPAAPIGIVINLKHRQHHLKDRKISSLHLREPIYKENLVLIITSDSASFVNSDIEGKWYGVEAISGDYTMEDLNRLFLHQSKNKQ